MPEAHSHVVGCTLKVLPEELRLEAARRAVQINRVNAPAREMLALAAPGQVPEPAQIALLTSRYWGAGGVKLTVGFMDDPPADLRKRILSHMNIWGSWANVHFTESTRTRRCGSRARAARTVRSGPGSAPTSSRSRRISRP